MRLDIDKDALYSVREAHANGKCWCCGSSKRTVRGFVFWTERTNRQTSTKYAASLCRKHFAEYEVELAAKLMVDSR